MKKIGLDLEHVEEQLAQTDKEIAVSRDEFWGNPNWNDEKAELEAKINALRDWKESLEATKRTIVVMNNGGIAQDVEKKVSQYKKPLYGVDLTRSER
ncbi:hypothetical protein KAT95_00615 [Candidatus Parcubacteria bacterium]|nr:hypothetical protein [Candidatus Parcubacteria bacterium]